MDSRWGNGYTYSYDNAGNILAANGHSYTYDDSTWADLLTAVDGETISYDAIGNPTSYYNGTSWSFTWTRGRSLATASDGTDTISYTYDADGLRTGKTVISPLDNSQKNGLFVDSDGETRYYVDGVATYAGLVYWDGYFYYFNSSLKAVRSRTYWPTVTNDLIPVAEYTFDENGRITNPPVVGIDAQGQLKNGIYADADGEIRYYVNGIATYAKLVYFNGHYYYIGSSLKAVRDTTHWVSATNGLMEAGSYTFDAQGRMIDPPEGALTEPVSTFALSGETMSKTYEYVYASGKLMRQVLTVTIGNSTTTYAMDFFYDASGYPFAVKYNGDLCYYITNLQGDVMSIVDAQGEVVAEYEYDPYGNIVSQSGPLADVNPLRYRGYVFDSETQFYYLQSRYYDPELGRFINADAYASTGQGIIGNNMFAYCNNKPIIRTDSRGTRGVNIWSFKSDEIGRELLCWYLYGEGKDFPSEARHSEYLKKNKLLRRQVQDYVFDMASGLSVGETIEVDESISVVIENGEDIIGYQYLHGTNAEVGGFQIQGTITRLDNDFYIFDLTYTWNDIMDPNPKYSSDMAKARLAEIIADPADYKISISWSDFSTGPAHRLGFGEVGLGWLYST